MRRPPREPDNFGRYKCVRCGYRYPVENFRIDKAKADGRRHECTLCESRARKARRRAGKLTDAERESARERNRRYRARVAGLVRAAIAANLSPAPRPEPKPWEMKPSNRTETVAGVSGGGRETVAGHRTETVASNRRETVASRDSDRTETVASNRRETVASRNSDRRETVASRPTVSQLNAAEVADLAAKATRGPWASGYDPADYPGLNPAAFDIPGFDPLDMSTWPKEAL